MFVFTRACFQNAHYAQLRRLFTRFLAHCMHHFNLPLAIYFPVVVPASRVCLPKTIIHQVDKKICSFQATHSCGQTGPSLVGWQRGSRPPTF